MFGIFTKVAFVNAPKASAVSISAADRAKAIAKAVATLGANYSAVKKLRTLN